MKRAFAAILLGGLLLLNAPAALSQSDIQKGLQVGGAASGYDIEKPLTANQIVARGVQLLLGVSGIILLIMIVYGGFTYFFAGGESDKTAKAKKILIFSALGMIIVLTAFFAVSYITGDIATFLAQNQGA